MKSRRKPRKSKKPAASAKASRSEEVRKTIAEYIDDQRKILQKLLRRLYH